MTSSSSGDLVLGHILAACGLDPADVLVLRHTYQEDGLRRGETTSEKMHAYARGQLLRFNASQPPVWLNFLAEPGRRSRFWGAFENHGEIESERTDVLRFFDLRPSDFMSLLANRLTIEWSKDAINWAKKGTVASAFPIVEIADPEAVAFPGYDNVLLDLPGLRAMVEDPRYAAWRTALGSVQGIYLITDTSTGKQYVGKADGGERILGRWSTYGRDGHGGNVALRDLKNADAEHSRHFQWSLLRVFGPSTPTAEVDAAEAHFKRALLSREFGLNRN
ncbi:GIY-YIG nuclease family protein [Nocardioides sp. P86]|uniref:GIY-YIG nuclease family protein n=1 Tax=Nocardioides sp. P86 TaxID=2939569 RepID=UPI00203C186F|nr:GIY-YIG nuclease family protein [Nocardioides sp. P86]MCM3516578.1 GIY-YIG nuclease family protein [Nocardioides sp. P86]